MKPIGTAESNVAVSWAHRAVDALAAGGVREIVVSPGSRSTPLVAAATAHPKIRDLSIIDERSAAFFALGASSSSGRPVALVCTSGTAAANYYPAICEADRARIPLIVMTADRPPALRESGSSQSMRQVGMYGDHVRFSHDFAVPTSEEAAMRYVAAMTNRAVAVARAEEGPVHLNFPFQKPLEPRPDSASGQSPFQPTAASTVYAGTLRGPDPLCITDVVRTLESASRPVFLVGASRDGHAWAEVLFDVATRVGAPVIAEASSQLRFGPWHDRVVAADVLLANRSLSETLRPDVIVRLGLPPLNWPVARWESSQSAHRIVVSRGYDSDPDHSANDYFVSDERAFLEAVRKRLPRDSKPSPWAARFVELGRQACRHIDESLQAQEGLFDAAVAHELTRALPDGATLVVSSSMPLREVEAFGSPRREALRVLGNRGLNGIDGVVSTTLGAASVAPGRTACLIGDVAFVHDVGALATARRLPEIGATIVVVDNGGGAIFDHLPVAGMEPMYARHFVTDPDLDLAAVAEAFGARVTTVEARAELRPALDEALAGAGLQVVVVKTSRQHADESRQQIFDAFVPSED